MMTLLPIFRVLTETLRQGTNVIRMGRIEEVEGEEPKLLGRVKMRVGNSWIEDGWLGR